MNSVNDAVAKRVAELLKKYNMSQYRLVQNSGLSTSRLHCIMNGKNKTVTLSTIILIAKGFKLTLLEFLDSPYFSYDKLDVE